MARLKFGPKRCPLCGAKKKHISTPDPSQGHICHKCDRSWSCSHDECPKAWWGGWGFK